MSVEVRNLSHLNKIISNKSEVIKKTYIEYDLCCEIVNKQGVIICELKNIMKTYKYNENCKKLKKHFPASLHISYDDYMSYLEHSKNKISFSLSSKTITEQIDEIFKTAFRRYNSTKSFLINKEAFFNQLYVIKSYLR